MMFEPASAKWIRLACSAVAIGALHVSAIAFALQAPPIPDDESQTGGAFIIELAAITASPDEERRDVALGVRSEEVAPVAASTPQQVSVATPEPVKDEPPLPEVETAEPEMAVAKPVEEPPKEETPPVEQAPSQAEDAPLVAPVAASEAAAPQAIENAEKKSDTPRGENTGLSKHDRRANENWQRDLVVHLNRHKRYPWQARSSGHRGIVNVAFVIHRDGSVHEPSIAKTSGHAMLDQAAIEMLQRASPLPVPPESIGGDAISLVVPVNFRWRD